MHLAQLNIARLVDDQDSPTVAKFMNAVEAINWPMVRPLRRST